MEWNKKLNKLLDIDHKMFYLAIRYSNGCNLVIQGHNSIGSSLDSIIWTNKGHNKV